MVCWSVVQLDQDEELGQVHGMYGTLDGEFEAQRTTKRVVLTGFLCLLRRVVEPTTVLVRHH